MRAWRRVQKYFGHFFIPGAHNEHRPRILHRPWLLFFLTITLSTEGFLVSNLIARQSDQQFLAAVVPAEIISLTNQERAANTVSSLTEDQLLDQAATAKAQDMAKNGYFSHTGPDGKTPWQWIAGSGYQYQYAGENLAVRFIDSKDVVTAWMDSPTHRANMVKPVYTQIGVGVAEGMYEGQPATYVVQYFGAPKSAAAVAASRAVTPSAAVAKAAPTPAVPTVEGAATEAVPPPAPPHTIASRQLIHAFGEPRQTSTLVLGLVAVLLLVALAFAFFTHLQVHHPNILIAGGFVAIVALSFLALNAKLIGGAAGIQSASVVTAAQGVILPSDAADTGYALFPN